MHTRRALRISVGNMTNSGLALPPPIPFCCERIRVRLGKLRDGRIAHLIVSVEAKDPTGRDLCLLDCTSHAYQNRLDIRQCDLRQGY